MKTILLARHARHSEVGRILSGRSDIGLNADGRAEATRLADRLSTVPLRAIHSSPCARARETAVIVAERHRLPVETIDALDEIDFGDWTGRSFADLDTDPDWQHWNVQRGAARCPSGETMTEATERAARHLAATEVDGALLCVSHCDIIRGLVARTLGLGFDRLLAFECDPASLTTLVVDGDGGGKVVTLNERPS